MSTPEIHALSDAYPAYINGKDFGTYGSLVIEEIPFTWRDEQNELSLPVHILKRSDNQNAFGPVKETVAGGKTEIVLMSGFATEGTEWLRMAVTLMHELPGLSQITILDHPSSAPSAVHGKMDAPFNTDGFERSGRVVSSLLTELSRSGKIHGRQSAVAISTGCPVILEANACHPELFGNLVLLAPGGMLNRHVKKMEKGAGSGSAEYLMRYFDDIAAEWRFRYHLLLKNNNEKNPSPYSKLKAAVNSTVRALSDHTVFENGNLSVTRTDPAVIIGDLRSYSGHPLWPLMNLQDKFGNAVFEIAAGLIGRRSNSFWTHFTGMWGDAPAPSPHVPVRTRQYMDDLKLVATDCTAAACKSVSPQQEVTVILGANDRAVPPEEFLKETDKVTISLLKNDNDKAEQTLVSIGNRVRERFPAAGTANVLIATGGSPSGHTELKAETELYGFLIARYLQKDSSRYA